MLNTAFIVKQLLKGSIQNEFTGGLLSVKKKKKSDGNLKVGKMAQKCD